MDCPDCHIPNVERLNRDRLGHWCPGPPKAGVPLQNERRRYAYDDRTLMTHEWLTFIESLPTLKEDT